MKMQLLARVLLLFSVCNSISQTGKQTISGDSETCDKSGEGQRKVDVDSCHERGNGVDDKEENEQVGIALGGEKKMEWHELDWVAYQALDINPDDKEDPTAR